MSAVRAVMARRRAQAGSPAPGFVPAAALKDSERLAQLNEGSADDLRKAAQGEIDRAKAAFKEARGVSWTAFINLPLLVLSKFADYRRWSPISTLIDDSEKSLAAGDKAASDADKRRSYAAAWNTARLAQGAILREAGDGKTGVIAILKEEAKGAGVDPEEVAETARQAGKKVADTAQDVASVVKWVALGLGAYGVVQAIGGLRRG